MNPELKNSRKKKQMTEMTVGLWCEQKHKHG